MINQIHVYAHMVHERRSWDCGLKDLQEHNQY